MKDVVKETVTVNMSSREEVKQTLLKIAEEGSYQALLEADKKEEETALVLTFNH